MLPEKRPVEIPVSEVETIDIQDAVEVKEPVKVPRQRKK